VQAEQPKVAAGSKFSRAFWDGEALAVVGQLQGDGLRVKGDAQRGSFGPGVAVTLFSASWAMR
jgi:hypothetical protein